MSGSRASRHFTCQDRWRLDPNLHGARAWLSPEFQSEVDRVIELGAPRMDEAYGDSVELPSPPARSQMSGTGNARTGAAGVDPRVRAVALSVQDSVQETVAPALVGLYL